VQYPQYQQPAQYQQQMQQPISFPSQNKETIGSGKIIAIVIVILILFAAIGVTIWYFVTKDSKTSSSTTSLPDQKDNIRQLQNRLNSRISDLESDQGETKSITNTNIPSLRPKNTMPAGKYPIVSQKSITPQDQSTKRIPINYLKDTILLGRTMEGEENKSRFIGDATSSMWDGIDRVKKEGSRAMVITTDNINKNNTIGHLVLKDSGHGVVHPCDLSNGNACGGTIGQLFHTYINNPELSIIPDDYTKQHEPHTIVDLDYNIDDKTLDLSKILQPGGIIFNQRNVSGKSISSSDNMDPNECINKCNTTPSCNAAKIPNVYSTDRRTCNLYGPGANVSNKTQYANKYAVFVPPKEDLNIILDI
jgi:hypothetical protein